MGEVLLVVVVVWEGGISNLHVNVDVRSICGKKRAKTSRRVQGQQASVGKSLELHGRTRLLCLLPCWHPRLLSSYSLLSAYAAVPFHPHSLIVQGCSTGCVRSSVPGPKCPSPRRTTSQHHRIQGPRYDKDNLLPHTSLCLTLASNPERPRECYKEYRTALAVT